MPTTRAELQETFKSVEMRKFDGVKWVKQSSICDTLFSGVDDIIRRLEQPSICTWWLFCKANQVTM